MDNTLDLHPLQSPAPGTGSRGLRGLDVMLGLCRGVLADGTVSEAESQVLRAWIRANPEVTREWPGSVVAGRLEKIYADGRVDEEERRDLTELLQQLIGGPAGLPAGAPPPTTLPIDRPPPLLAFPGKVYVFAGKLAFGPLARCAAAVRDLGGRCEVSVTPRTDVVVIGTFARPDWVHTSYGSLIQKAVHYRERGFPIAIVAEDYWAAHL